MKSLKHHLLGAGVVLSLVTMVWASDSPARFVGYGPDSDFSESADTGEVLPYPFEDRIADPYNSQVPSSPMYMSDPSNVKSDVEYDTDLNRYNINEKVGNLFYRNPSYLSFEEFVDREYKNSTRDYWRQRAGEDDKNNKKVFAPKITVNSQIFDRIFGGNTIDIRPQGSAELFFALNIAKNENPALPERQRRVTTFDFREQIQMNVIANIGDKMKLTTNYNTQATFDFENQMKIEYTGYEDDIIRKIDAGNINFPLNSQLIQGSQSLFGVKTQLQFGKLSVTSVYSQQRGKSQTIEVKGGAQAVNFTITADQYETNRHFFLSQFFKDSYDRTLSQLNRISSPFVVTRAEVWVTSRSFIASQTQQNRNIVAFADLGEYLPDSNQTLIGRPSAFPYNVPEPSDSSNDLYAQLGPGALTQLRSISAASTILDPLCNSNTFCRTRNFETVENARLLQPSEYTLNPQLGYISLNTALEPSQVLAVAFEYTYNGKLHRVGEISTYNSNVNGTQALFVKLLRSTSYTPKFYTWDLMMRNVYSLGGYNVSPKDFRLDVLYQDDRIGGNINFIPEGCSTVEGIQLIRLFNMDQLNPNLDPQPDGIFDFVNGITINAQTGRIIFPVREPFGSYLRSKFCGNTTLADQYAYDALYDSTKTAAQQQPEKNKFSLRGTYQASSGNDIPLNAINVPRGSVTVTAGGVPLKENVDFTVDYTLGRVKIINDGILKSNTPIKVSLESQQLFNLQTKTMFGNRFEYQFNKDFQLGATMLHLNERPLTQKVNIGDEPISNWMLGVDGTYRTDSRFLTKMLDKLPFYNTKEVSTITVSGEAAKMIPGYNRAIGKGGNAYIDDFEGAITPLDLRNPGSWFLASTPLGQTDPGMFPESDYNDSIINGFNRARTAWYYVDPLFQRDQSGLTPPDVDANDQSNNYVREIPQAEVFPNRSQIGGPQVITCMNLAYYPNERGHYNYDVAGAPGISAGINADGTLRDPGSRWGGIMRRIETTDFEASNIEFIQFWMMDPFAGDSPNDGSGGELYFNLGNLSEDILRDGYKSFENGLPAPTNNSTTGTSNWGLYPNIQSIVNAFDNDPASRSSQDIGLDGLNDFSERTFFQNKYLNRISTLYGTGSTAYQSAESDPSSDNYVYFLNPDYSDTNASPLSRYKRWNGHEGNSPANGTIDGLQSTATTLPDMEDINRDNNMEVGENYWQYKVSLRPSGMVVGQNYIADVIESPVRYANNTTGSIKWYQFKIPIRQPDKTVGEVDLQNIRFIRMFMKDFQRPVILRFARLELLRGDWRTYLYSLLSPGEYSPTPEVPGETEFDISAVSIEENGARDPIPYVVPPGIVRERDITTTQVANLNEASLSMRVCKLDDGDARAAYRNTQLDMRAYKKMQMFAHAESRGPVDNLQNGQLHLFVRIGTDLSQNYYEYDLPLTVTPWNTSATDLIWPESNNIELDLEKLVEVKLKRNNAQLTNPNISLLTPYTITDGDRTITVKGSPNLSNVRSILIGVRNPKDADGNGEKLCAEVWVNELRMTDFDQQGGWASTARVTAKLADLGNMSLVGNQNTAGWRSIEKKLSDQDRFNRLSYDFSTNVELGKFLPDKSGVKVPMYFSYGESFVNPEFNPLDPDVPMTQALDATPNNEVRDSIEQQIQDYTQRKSINFTNVRKTKTGQNAKSRIYDIENLNFTYIYNELYKRNYNVSYGLAKNTQGAIAYNFNRTGKPIQPFEKSKSKILGSTWLRFIKDFNFNPMPSALNARIALDRTYAETQLRNNTGAPFLVEPTFIKTFNMNRTYGMNWDLTKALKLDFNSSAMAIIDEPAGRIDTEQERDSIKTNIKRLGRLNNYRHTWNLTYNLPFSKIPLTDWISANVRYGADFGWVSSGLVRDSASGGIALNPFANTISNSQTIQLNGNFTFTNLYNKIPLLKRINSQSAKSGTSKTNTVKAKGAAGDSLKTGKDKKPESEINPFVRGIGNFIMMVKTGSITYSETNGTSLPGFRPRPDFMGQDWNYPGSSGPAPNLGFVVGSQADIRPLAVRNQWLTTDTALNSFYSTNHQENLSARLTVEPIKAFKVELSANRTYSITQSSFFRANANGAYNTYSPTQSGNFTISYLTWSTQFVKDDKTYSNQNWVNFLAYRSEASQLLADKNPNYVAGNDTIPGFRNGYGPSQPEVLTTAFLSAYSGKTPSEQFTNRFPSIPKPNWRITYDGLSRVPLFQKVLQSFNLTHGYRSVYSVNSYTQNLLYEQSNDFPSNRDTTGNFIPQYDFQQITISEQLSPLIGVDMTWKNSLQTRIEIRRDRTLTLAYSNIQVTEVRGVEYVIGIGYKFKKVKFPIRMGNKPIKSDLSVRADINMRNNTTILRRAIEGTNQPSAGSRTLGVKFSADYPINERFNIRAFYDFNSNNPFVSSSYPTSNTNAGLSVRFTLAQ
ncbi:MAG: cell surface protein SprA [Bacteroidota bacterium]